MKTTLLITTLLLTGAFGGTAAGKRTPPSTQIQDNCPCTADPISHLATVIISGSGFSGKMVQIQINGQIAYAAVDGSGNFSYTDSYGPGSYDYTVSSYKSKTFTLAGGGTFVVN
jgi:hypothetical protein